MSTGQYMKEFDVPKDVQENMLFRQKILTAARKDKNVSRQLWLASSRDILFYLNAFAWTYSPKDNPDAPNVPFVTWEYQDDALAKMVDAIGHNDILIEKSRDMGASWLCLMAFFWRWHFYPNQTFLLVSRVEDLVDKKNEPDCLMWKLDWVLKNEPGWMRPKIQRQKLSMYNASNDSTITGSSTTGETSRGGRKTGILFDEFASVEDGYAMLSASGTATNTRFLNSTPKGTGNAFADQAERYPDEWKIRMHWSLHPHKSEGLYQSVDGELDIRRGRRDHGYPYIFDGRLRSPWYDEQCRRAVSDQEIAQELDIDYHRSGWQFFDPASMKEVKGNTRPPYHTGEIVWDHIHQPQFVESEGGRLRLWCNVDARGVPPADREYVIGCDIATGKGGSHSSQSAMSVLDKITGEKIGEFTSPNILPTDFAEYVLAACHWFKGKETAFLIWEANGPGENFGSIIMKNGYFHIYFRMNEDSIVKKRQKVPGWWTQIKSKRKLLGDYGDALKTGAFINRSWEAIEELAQFVHMPNGDISHMKGSTAVDPTIRGVNHGDIVIADALAWRGSKEIVVEASPEGVVIPDNCAYRRIQARQKALASTQNGYWD